MSETETTPKYKRTKYIYKFKDGFTLYRIIDSRNDYHFIVAETICPSNEWWSWGEIEQPPIDFVVKEFNITHKQWLAKKRNT